MGDEDDDTPSLSRGLPPHVLLNLTDDFSPETIEARFTEYSKLVTPDGRYYEDLEEARQTVGDPAKRAEALPAAFRSGGGLFHYESISATPDQLYRKEVVTKAFVVRLPPSGWDSIAGEATIPLQKRCLPKFVIPGVKWTITHRKAGAPEVYLAYRLDERPFVRDNICARRAFPPYVANREIKLQPDMLPTLIVEHTLPFSLFRNPNWPEHHVESLRAGSVPLSELFDKDDNDLKTRTSDAFACLVRELSPEPNDPEQLMDVTELQRTFAVAPPQRPEALWQVVRTLFAPGLVHEPTLLWDGGAPVSDEERRAAAARLWEEFRPYVRGAKATRAVFFESVYKRLPPLWQSVLRPGLPRAPLCFHHRYLARECAWDGTDARYVITVGEQFTFDRHSLKIRTAGPEDTDSVYRLLAGGSEKVMRAQDVAVFLSAKPVVSLLALDGAEPVAVLLGSLRYAPRLPNKRPLSAEATAALGELLVRLPGEGDRRIRNCFIALVHVSGPYRHEGVGRRLVQLFVELCGSVYGVLSFTTEVPDREREGGREAPLTEFYRRQHFRVVGREPNRFADGEGGRWLERDILLEDALAKVVGQPSSSPFFLLGVDCDSPRHLIEEAYAQCAALRTHDPAYYAELRVARDVLLDPERKAAALRALFPTHGERGSIIFETVELNSLEVATKRSHQFTVELPPPYSDDIRGKYRFEITLRIAPGLLSGFLVPDIRVRDVTPPDLGLPSDPGYAFAVRLHERPFVADLNSRKCRVFRRPRNDGPSDLFVEHFLPLELFQEGEWHKYEVPRLQGGQLRRSAITLWQFTELEPPPAPAGETPPTPQKRGAELKKRRLEVLRQLQAPPPSKQNAAARGGADDRRLWASIMPYTLPPDAFMLDHPYVVAPLEPRYLFRVQGERRFRDRPVKIRSVCSEADIPRIAELVRGDGEELFGHYSYRAFVSVPPVVCFLALYRGENAQEKKARAKRLGADAHKWSLAGVVLGSVRHPPRKKEPEPEHLDELRVKIGATREPITTGYIALVKVKKEFTGARLGSWLVDYFISFCVNVYGVTWFNAELPDDDAEALAFYESRGFRRAKHVPRYYPDGKGSFWVEKNRLQEAVEEGRPPGWG
jgi:ribosomal protein S18 acetylase RimI-like enzyme